MKITASIQARMSSRRLPGKVLRKILGKPLLQWQIERLRRSRLVDSIVIATSTSSMDDQIEDFCRGYGVECYRGPEDDVLTRIAEMVENIGIETHVECYGDSPLVDPAIVDEFIGYFIKHNNLYDYVSSAILTTYPPGLETTLYSGKIIVETNKLVSKDDPLREHAAFNITRFPERFRIKSLEAPSWYRAPDLYLEVDTSEDLWVIEWIISRFLRERHVNFGLSDILNLARRHPKIFKVNSLVERKWMQLRGI